MKITSRVYFQGYHPNKYNFFSESPFVQLQSIWGQIFRMKTLQYFEFIICREYRCSRSVKVPTDCFSRHEYSAKETRVLAGTRFPPRETRRPTKKQGAWPPAACGRWETNRYSLCSVSSAWPWWDFTKVLEPRWLVRGRQHHPLTREGWPPAFLTLWGYAIKRLRSSLPLLQASSFGKSLWSESWSWKDSPPPLLFPSWSPGPSTLLPSAHTD